MSPVKVRRLSIGGSKQARIGDIYSPRISPQEPLAALLECHSRKRRYPG
jgi:hypothetical protein